MVLRNRINERLLELAHVPLEAWLFVNCQHGTVTDACVCDVYREAVEVEDGVPHQLSRAVERRLTAAYGLSHDPVDAGAKMYA